MLCLLLVAAGLALGLEEGHAVVADFGVARAVAAAGSGALTATGVAVGVTDTIMVDDDVAESVARAALGLLP